MSKNEMLAKLELLNEWERIIEEAKAEAELIKDEIKAEMDERELEEMVVGSYVVRYKTISNSRFDSTAFKKYNIDLYKAFLKQFRQYFQCCFVHCHEFSPFFYL